MKIELARAFALMLFAFASTGCVKNQLLRLEAHDFSKQAIVVADSARSTYLERMQAENEFHDLAYALDARCVPPRYRAKTNPRLPPPRSDEQSEIYKLCYNLNHQFTYESFEEQFEAIDFVASYVSALAMAAAEPEMAASAQFAQAAADFKVLKEALNKKGPSDEKVKAISSLLDAIELAADDAASAEKIRLAFTTYGASAQAEMVALSNDLLPTSDDTGFDRALSNKVRELVVRTPASGAIGGMSRRELMEDMHQHELNAWIQARSLERCKKTATKELCRYCPSPAAGLMYAASKAHTEFSGLIEGKPSYRQRQRAASLAYRQFISIVGVFVGLRTSF